MTADEIKVLERVFDAKLEPLGKQLDRLEKKVEQVEEKLETVDERLGKVESTLDEFKSTTEGTFLVITEDLNKLADKDTVLALENRIAALESQHKN